jgi:hypothetical protein
MRGAGDYLSVPPTNDDLVKNGLWPAVILRSDLACSQVLDGHVLPGWSPVSGCRVVVVSVLAEVEPRRRRYQRWPNLVEKLPSRSVRLAPTLVSCDNRPEPPARA